MINICYIYIYIYERRNGDNHRVSITYTSSIRYCYDLQGIRLPDCSSTWKGHIHLIFKEPEAMCATDIHNLVLLNPLCKLKY